MTVEESIIAALEKDADHLLAESNNRNNRPAQRRQYALLYSGIVRALKIARAAVLRAQSEARV